MKILVVEDELPTAQFLKRGLGEEGYAVDVVHDGNAAEAAVHDNEYDAILVDAMIPAPDGFELCRRWRGSGRTTPIIFLTAKDEIRDRVAGLDLGADDYLVKPFAFNELLARLRAVIRRRGGAAMPALRVGDLVVDPARRRVTVRGRAVELTAREYQLLEYLAHNAGKVVTRTALWNHVWESHREPDSNVVDVYVRYLRRKLADGGALIKTLRGAGYMLSAENEE